MKHIRRLNINEKKKKSHKNPWEINHVFKKVNDSVFPQIDS